MIAEKKLRCLFHIFILFLCTQGNRKSKKMNLQVYNKKTKETEIFYGNLNYLHGNCGNCFSNPCIKLCDCRKIGVSFAFEAIPQKFDDFGLGAKKLQERFWLMNWLYGTGRYLALSSYILISSNIVNCCIIDKHFEVYNICNFVFYIPADMGNHFFLKIVIAPYSLMVSIHVLEFCTSETSL